MGENEENQEEKEEEKKPQIVFLDDYVNQTGQKFGFLKESS